MHHPCEGHWNATKRVLKYLKGTQPYAIKYSKVLDFHLIGYSDSYFDGDKDHGVSTSSYLMNLGSEPWVKSYRMEIMKAICSC